MFRELVSSVISWIHPSSYRADSEELKTLKAEVFKLGTAVDELCSTANISKEDLHNSPILTESGSIAARRVFDGKDWVPERRKNGVNGAPPNGKERRKKNGKA